jgi:hypothetical protein
MYMNGTYKAFVAETAAKVAAEISMCFTRSGATAGDVSLLMKDDATCEKIAIASVNVAEHLATKLQEWWTCKGDRQTVMFDPQDSLTSRIENELSDIAEKLQDIEAEMERQYKNDHMDEQ